MQVAMAVGFIDPEPREKVRPPRKQVLVVVTANFKVMAFDHNLQLMWEQNIDEQLPPHARLNEVRLLHTTHAQAADLAGCIILCQDKCSWHIFVFLDTAIMV